MCRVSRVALLTLSRTSVAPCRSLDKYEIVTGTVHTAFFCERARVRAVARRRAVRLVHAHEPRTTTVCTIVMIVGAHYQISRVVVSRTVCRRFLCVSWRGKWRIPAYIYRYIKRTRL